MSREHHAGCIPSRTMSPWLSSAFGMQRLILAYVPYDIQSPDPV
jgi:hypothetical protein